MAVFAGDLQDEAIREPQRWAPAKAGQGRRNCIRILERQMLFTEQSFDHSRDVRRLAPKLDSSTPQVSTRTRWETHAPAET